MNSNIVGGEYFDLIGTVVVIDDAADIDGLTHVGVCRDGVAVGVLQDGGTHIDHASVGSLTGQGHGALGGAVLIGGGVDVNDLQILHRQGGAHDQLSVGEFITAFLALDGDLALEGSGICQHIGRLVAFAELLQVVGIIGLHDTVAHVGDLPGAAALVELDRAHDADLVAHLQDLQAGGAEVEAVVDIHTEVQAGFGIQAFHINAVVVLLSKDVVVKQGLYLPEGISCRELIHYVLFESGHELPV